MERLVRHFASRVIFMHVLLLALVLVLVGLALREVYGRVREQAIAQTVARQNLLAGQTASGIEQYYRGIVSDLGLLSRAETDEILSSVRPPHAPELPPPLRKRLGEGRRPPMVFGRLVWTQLEGRVAYLFAVYRPEPVVARYFPEQPRVATTNATEREKRREDHRQELEELTQLIDRSKDWLTQVDKPTIGPFVRTQSVGYCNLLAVPIGDDFLAVAVVPVRTVKMEFIDPLNAPRGAAAWLVDDEATVMASFTPSLQGKAIRHPFTEPELAAMAREILAKGKPASRVIETRQSLAGVELRPTILNAHPVDVAGRRLWVIIGSSLGETDSTVTAVFGRALVWAVVVVVSVTGILLSTAVQMIRSRLKLERERHDALNKEVQQARKIQLSWLPQSGKSVPGLTVAAVNHPASQVSGDFYNWFQLPDGRAAVVIGDVTGHGMAATFLMATTQLLVRTTLERVCDPGECLAEVNRQLCTLGYSGQFVTMLLMVVDCRCGAVEVASAGHFPPLVIDGQGVRSVEMDTQLVLGLDADVEYETVRAEVPGGSTVVLYTDGVIEAQAEDGGRMGLMPLIHELEGNPGGTVEQTVDAIVAAVRKFCGARELGDDLTLVVLRVDGTGGAMRMVTTPAAAGEELSD